MNMMNIHKEAVETENPVYHEFLCRFSKNKKCVYGFVEGKEDISYYRGFIEHMIPHNWMVELWPVRNKDYVKKLHSIFDWTRFSRKQIAFFIDKDLSLFLNEDIHKKQNIYTTDNYSIENDIVTPCTLDRVLTEIYNLTNLSKEEKDNILNAFEKELNSFAEAMIPVMSWIIYWRKIGLKPVLNEIYMKHLFSLSNGKLNIISKPQKKRSVEEYIHSQCNITFDKNVNIDLIKVELQAQKKYVQFVRGKYLMWFLIEFACSIHKSLVKSLRKSPKIHVTLSQSNGVILIGPRARIPDSLKSFLKKTYVKYINETKNVA